MSTLIMKTSTDELWARYKLASRITLGDEVAHRQICWIVEELFRRLEKTEKMLRKATKT